MTVLIVSMVVGFALAGTILYLVRRDHLHGSYAVWWLAVATVTLVLAVFPHIVDWLGNALGIAYPPILAIVIAMAFTLIRMLQMDIDRSRQERALRRLTQRLAILDEELGEMRSKLAQIDPNVHLDVLRTATAVDPHRATRAPARESPR